MQGREAPVAPELLGPANALALVPASAPAWAGDPSASSAASMAAGVGPMETTGAGASTSLAVPDLSAQLAAIQAQLAGLSSLVGLESRMANTMTSMLAEAVRPLAQQVEAQEARMDQHDVTLGLHASRLDRIEAHALGTASPQPGADAGPRPSESAPTVGGGVFQPSFVEARGWATFDNRQTHGLTRTQCQAIVGSLKGQLAPEIAQHVGEVQVRGMRNYTFRINVRGGAAVAFEVAGVANDLVAEGSLQLPVGAPNRSALRFATEKSPPALARQASLLRVLRAVEAKVKALTEQEARWAVAEASPNWRESCVEVLGLPGGKITVASFELGGAICWCSEGLASLGATSGAQLLAAGPGPARR